MSKLHWLFPPRRVSVAPVDGAMILDRLEARLGTAVNGDARLVLASQLDLAVTRIGQSQSLSTVALTAQREGARIAAMLPRPFASAIGPILVDELVRSRPVPVGGEQRI